MPIQIHGKQYNTVAERIISAGKDLLSVHTEVLCHEPVVIKATITVSKEVRPLMSIGKESPTRSDCVFTGISAANASKQIEKESPYEVAETSAVGRALAFAGYETTNGIASYEEMQKINPNIIKDIVRDYDSKKHRNYDVCPECNAKTERREGISQKTGNPWVGYFCTVNKNHKPIFVNQPKAESKNEVKDVIIPNDMPF